MLMKFVSEETAAVSEPMTLDPTLALDDETCWQAMSEKDARYDGTFVSAISSTGIYCRPSCPARKPLRKHVRFYADPGAAEAAGYRACKRCRPDAVAHEAEVVESLIRYIEANLDQPLTLTALGERAGYSPTHLQRVFKRVAGLSPRQYVEAARVQRLKDELRQTDRVTDAVYEAGFNSASRVYEGSSAKLGMNPSAYQRGGRGVDIQYTIVDSPLGRLLVAASPQGVAGVSLSDDDATLHAYIQDEFPRATLSQPSPAFAAWVQEVLRQLDGELPHTELPLDVQATAFQRRVWQELQRIPLGETRTYSEIARAIGQPTAARAVARACATNRIAVVIPCHRVIREDGTMGGYRWGLHVKELLLKRERERSGKADKAQVVQLRF
jgi:AraC family transcriptional regulator of adaptative response/methylated-DNA-[protein]-cysteine methyltransferase